MRRPAPCPRSSRSCRRSHDRCRRCAMPTRNSAIRPEGISRPPRMITTPGSLREAASLLEQKLISPVELTRACLDRIASENESLRAFITVMADEALADAARAEKDIVKNRYRGPLHGIPVSIKDLVDIAGTPTTSGSAVPPRRPRHDAPVVSRLRAAGAVIVGKTNLHEFAYGTTSDETAFGA